MDGIHRILAKLPLCHQCQTWWIELSKDSPFISGLNLFLLSFPTCIRISSVLAEYHIVIKLSDEKHTRFPVDYLVESACLKGHYTCPFSADENTNLLNWSQRPSVSVAIDPFCKSCFSLTRITMTSRQTAIFVYFQPTMHLRHRLTFPSFSLHYPFD